MVQLMMVKSKTKISSTALDDDDDDDLFTLCIVVSVVTCTERW
jgi:hypothetical protein